MTMTGGPWKALAALVFLATLTGARPPVSPVDPIPVRFAEGVTHGFLVLRTLNGQELAHGDLLQSVKEGVVEVRMLFKFKDGSVLDENTTYTQSGVFKLQTYHLIQNGPSFKADTEIRMDRSTGKYRVVSKSHKDGKAKTDEGTLELPPDVYNGMVMLIAKNFAKGAGATVHYVAFTPKPRIIQLEYSPTGSEKVPPQELPGTLVRYRIKPQLGTLLKVMSAVLGKTPPDMHAWVVHETVPAFVRFEGPVYMGGPIWRIETTAPRLPEPLAKGS